MRQLVPNERAFDADGRFSLSLNDFVSRDQLFTFLSCFVFAFIISDEARKLILGNVLFILKFHVAIIQMCVNNTETNSFGYKNN